MASTVSRDEACANHLLSSLPETDLNKLLPALTPVDLELGAVLYESGEAMEVGFFPTSAIISLLFIMENGSTAEIGVIGNDGIVGSSIILGGGTTTNRAVVQSAGRALQIGSSELKAQFKRVGKFQDVFLLYTQALMTQISQTAVCNRLHPIEQQLCRWLLLSHDRLNSDKLVMTHDLISNMLGVRREGITLAAQKLGARKLITNRRGTITVIDREGLEHAACECYRVVKDEYERLLGNIERARNPEIVLL